MTGSDSDDDISRIAHLSLTDSSVETNRDQSSFSDNNEESNACLISFIYNGGIHDVVPEGVHHIRVDPSVRRIRRKAFQSCFNLKTLQLNEGLEVIGQDAFNNCDCLYKVTIPSTVYDIKRGSFYECCNLLEVNIPDGLQIIGARAFAGCSNLMRIKIPSAVNEIRTGAFCDCRALAAAEFSEGLQRIGVYAFGSCFKLESVWIPSTVREIGERAFQGCTSLISVAIEDGLWFIENSTFQGCNSLRMIRIPSSVRIIDSYAFCWCHNLISIEFAPSGLSFIGAGEFGLSIGAAVFHGCDSLRNIFMEPHVRTVPDLDIFASSDPGLDSPPNSLQQIFPRDDDNHATLLEGLRKRFDDLPIHKTCYYQAHSPTEGIRAVLQRALQRERGTTESVDVFGMTPFHLLALSTKPDSSLFATLLERYPVSFACQEDMWGYTPMDYLVWNRTTIKQGHSMHRLFKLTVVDRGLRCSYLQRWKNEIEGKTKFLLKKLRNNPRQRKLFGRIYATLDKYEKMEATSLMELALWKLKIDEVSSPVSTVRQDCRVTSGANVVIPNVLSFLGKVVK
jgi:hypothetical protein